jgi:nitrite reductase/ring-hydroxylating ferredoxin subunit
MQPISRLEQNSRLDGVVSAGQRVARLVPPGKVRDALHGVWLGHPLHPVLIQVSAGAWLSASILDFTAGGQRAARRLVAAGLIAAVPAAVAGAADWSEQHEQQMRVGVVHAAGNIVASSLYGASLLSRGPRLSRALRLAGLAAVSASGLLGGHISFRLAGGANHAEEVPHLVKPGWHHLMTSADLPEGRLVREMLGEIPVVAIRARGTVHVLADRCSHMSGPLSDGKLADGCLTCPWHGSVFRIADGSVVHGPATAPQPAFQTREVGGAIQVCLPGAG